ncbi:MAG: SIMPL domain-containing protein [Actinobacteria bacterium]|nr:SIMPL domain-containing protein [Actinomycetota bacterium]
MRNRMLLPIALVLSLLILAAPAAALGAERTVSVEATTTVKVPNDSASVGLGVSLTRGSRGAALKAVSAKLKNVIVAVQGIPGVGSGDVKTGRVGVAKLRGGQFRAGEGITVTLHQPAKAGDLIQAAIGAGATGVRGPVYFVGDTEAAYATALGAAFQKAKAKAATLAAQAGATLGQALTITEGGKPEIVPYPAAKHAPSSGCGVSSPAAGAQQEACAVGPVTETRAQGSVGSGRTRITLRARRPGAFAARTVVVVTNLPAAAAGTRAVAVKVRWAPGFSFACRQQASPPATLAPGARSRCRPAGSLVQTERWRAGSAPLALTVAPKLTTAVGWTTPPGPSSSSRSRAGSGSICPPWCLAPVGAGAGAGGGSSAAGSSWIETATTWVRYCSRLVDSSSVAAVAPLPRIPSALSTLASKPSWFR